MKASFFVNILRSNRAGEPARFAAYLAPDVDGAAGAADYCHVRDESELSQFLGGLGMRPGAIEGALQEIAASGSVSLRGVAL